MSRGTRSYIYYQMEEELEGRMYDREIDDLIEDVIELARDVEWYESGDIEKDDYLKTVQKFKEKWFQTPREDRLKKYVDNSIENTKKELYQIIGVKTDG